MEANQTVEKQSEGGAGMSAKQRHNRIKKFNPEDIVGLPGVVPRQVKIEPTDDTYSIVFNINVGEEVGTNSEGTNCLFFSHSLNKEAMEKDIGKVTAVRFENGICETVLTLNVREKPQYNSIPVKNAFAGLGNFLNTAEFLQSSAGRAPVIWKAKIRNTTVVEGHF